MTNLKLRYVRSYRDRHGKLRHEFRRRGAKNVPLPGLPGSEEFMTAYHAAVAGTPDSEPDAERLVPGSINALVAAYYASDAWKAFAEKTRQVRRRYIERFRALHGKRSVASLKPQNIANQMAGISPASAKVDWLKAIKGLLEAAKPLLRKDNPADGLKAGTKAKSKGFHTWTNEQVDQYRAYWALGTQQRLAFEIGLEGLSRRCEIVALGPQHVKNGRIEIARGKGSNDVNILMTPELAEAVEAMPKGHLNWFVTAYGAPRTIAGLGEAFVRWATEAGLPRQCRLHGLKKAGMRRMAESSATTHEIMAVSGHKTLDMDELYTEEFDRKVAGDRGIAKRIANKSV